MTHVEFVLKYLQKQPPEAPIYIRTIAEALANASPNTFGLARKKASSAVSIAIKRILNKGEMPDLRRYQKGIYYRTSQTVFGETLIDCGQLIADKYLLPDKGYITGHELLHRMGLTTQMPNRTLIATNAASDCIRYDKKLHVYTCPPKTTITADNKRYLQFLDALALFDNAPVDAEHPYAILFDYAKKFNLRYETLRSFADKFYNRKTILQLAHVASRKEIRRGNRI